MGSVSHSNRVRAKRVLPLHWAGRSPQVSGACTWVGGEAATFVFSNRSLIIGLSPLLKKRYELCQTVILSAIQQPAYSLA